MGAPFLEKRLPPNFMLMAMEKGRRLALLKKGLDGLYKRFDRSLLSPDPLECVPTRGKFEDIELSAFLAATFAYGRADLIVKNVRGILAELGEHPHRALMDGAYKTRFKGFKYRFHKRPDILWLLERLCAIYKKFGAIENAYCAAPGTAEERLERFATLFREKGKPLTQAQKFLVTSPASGACKRMNLFLRWMVRNDAVDLGLWTKVKPAELIIPLDVHVHRIAGRLKLVGPKAAANFKTARELTDTLKRFNEEDPVRYDFAICSLGKLGHCLKQPDPASCLSCALAAVCKKS
ncbi:MAG: TIGR02757 family protein [Nitrospinae bacterium]|nr:TIGR02757 family protein [Nitrospinota bacterium]